jgi:SEC-C motif
MSERGRADVSPYSYTYGALSVFWPEPEFHALIARWPRLADYLGETWDEHRQRIERHCALTERAGLRVEQLSADLHGFEAFLADRGVTNPGKDDLLGYPDLRSVVAAMEAWPPARSAACWCGSGRTYKKCCRPHGLGGLD